MRVFNICTNISNGAGLQRDYELMRRMLENLGHKVNGLMFNQYQQPVPQADVSICLEVMTEQHLCKPGRGENWFVPNSEWFYPCWNSLLPRFSKILCKTKDCYDIWSKKVGAAKCVFIGFESLDFYDPSAGRFPYFLHMAGKSQTKNTQAVCQAWKQFNLPYPLTVVAFKQEIIKHTIGVPNLTHVVRYTDEEVAKVMNSHIFHIMPSKYEGFGHYIHEAIGCGGMVLTTNAAPMNQFNGIFPEFLIPVERKEKCLEAWFNLVSPAGIAQVVRRAAGFTATALVEKHHIARKAFLTDREHFRIMFNKVANGEI